MAGPLEAFVERVHRRIEAFQEEQSLEKAEVEVVLFDGARHKLRTLSAEPGFGFVTLYPYEAAAHEAQAIIVPVGAIRAIELSAPDPERPFGVAPSASA